MTVQPARITSRDNALLVRLRRLARQPGDYRKQGLVLLEGEHLCSAWVQHGGDAPEHAVVAESAWPSAALRELAESAQQVVVVSDALMAGIASLATPPAIVFAVARPRAPAVDADAPTVVLDRVQDAGNVGSILRSAAAFDFRQVIALQGTAGLWSPKVLRAAMGGHFGLALIEGAAIQVIDALRVPLLGTSSHAQQALGDAALPWPCAWVIGNEGEGMSADLAARCAMQVCIPQPGGQESLNAAAAAAVCLYESMRGRMSRSRAISPPLSSESRD